MKIKLLNIDGAKSDFIEISDKVINLKVNYKLIKYVVDWQLNHLKPRLAKTKQRNEIRGSTRKIVAQKGTGGARHASKKAPLFVGGGIAHGPKGAVYKVKKINKKVRKLALAQTLSKKNIDKNLHILNDVKKEIKKTKEFNKFLEKNPYTAHAWYEIGKLYFKKNKIKESIASHEFGIISDETFSPCYIELGKLYEKKQDFKKSIYYYKIINNYKKD